MQVEIVYSGGTTPRSKRLIEPYKLFEKFGRNYIESYCYLRKEFRTFRVDRISAIEVLNSPCEKKRIYEKRAYNLPGKVTNTSVTNTSTPYGIATWVWVVIGLIFLLYFFSKFFR